eukprot:COSAG02_NODE_2199_length_9541_cov_28.299301_2_plen_82_part_00
MIHVGFYFCPRVARPPDRIGHARRRVLSAAWSHRAPRRAPARDTGRNLDSEVWASALNERPRSANRAGRSACGCGWQGGRR